MIEAQCGAGARYDREAGAGRGLTERQECVADGIRRGLSYREIALELCLSLRTVHSHVEAIMNALPNPDGLDPYLCIFLWARHREWTQLLAGRGADAER